MCRSGWTTVASRISKAIVSSTTRRAGHRPGAQTLTASEFWSTECEFLIPAALEEQITEVNAHSVRAKIIVEGANGPVTPAADDILKERGVLLVG